MTTVGEQLEAWTAYRKKKQYSIRFLSLIIQYVKFPGCFTQFNVVQNLWSSDSVGAISKDILFESINHFTFIACIVNSPHSIFCRKFEIEYIFCFIKTLWPINVTTLRNIFCVQDPQTLEDSGNHLLLSDKQKWIFGQLWFTIGVLLYVMNIQGSIIFTFKTWNEFKIKE